MGGTALRSATVSSVIPTLFRTRRAVLLTAAIGVLAGAAGWRVASLRGTPAASAPFSVDGLAAPPRSTEGRWFALSPDGRFIAFVRDDGGSPSAGPTLVRRDLDSGREQRLAGPAAGLVPDSPFVSPDAGTIGFLSRGDIMKVAAAGGEPTRICTCAATAAAGAAWLSDGSVVYGGRGRLRLRRADGSQRDVTRPSSQDGERSHLFPVVLPGDRVLLYTAERASPPRFEVRATNIDTGVTRSVVADAMSAQFMAPNLVVYVDGDGQVRATRFDPRRLRVTRPVVTPSLIVRGVDGEGAPFVLAQNGTIAYASTGGEQPLQHIRWVDRDGHEESVPLPARGYQAVRIDRAERAVLLDIREADANIWLWYPGQDHLSRLTTGARNFSAVWMADGRGLFFASNRDGDDNVYTLHADRVGQWARLFQSQRPTIPHVITPDGRTLLVRETRRRGVRFLAVDAERGDHPREVIPIGDQARSLSLSPDGQWTAFESTISGHSEIYVTPLANDPGTPIAISVGGGEGPLWSPTGDEIFFMNPLGELTRVEVRTQPTFSAGAPAPAFPAGYSTRHWLAGRRIRPFDLTPDGRRFLAVIRPSTGEDLQAPELITHWMAQPRWTWRDLLD